MLDLSLFEAVPLVLDAAVQLRVGAGHVAHGMVYRGELVQSVHVGLHAHRVRYVELPDFGGLEGLQLRECFELPLEGVEVAEYNLEELVVLPSLLLVAHRLQELLLYHILGLQQHFLVMIAGLVEPGLDFFVVPACLNLLLLFRVEVLALLDHVESCRPDHISLDVCVDKGVCGYIRSQKVVQVDSSTLFPT